MKLFALGGHGVNIPASVSSVPGLNLVAYASLVNEKTVSLTLINKTHGAGSETTQIALKLYSQAEIASAQVIYLKATQADPTAASGITVGGVPIQQDGNWNGQWTPLPISSEPSAAIALSMPALSAAVVKIQLK